MKALLLTVLSVLLFALLWGAPLRNVPTILEQPDGTKYPCFMTGDEYYHRAHDANGFTIIKDLATGWHVYAQKQGPDLSTTAYVPGVDDPASRGLAPNLMPDESILRQRFQNWRGANRDEFGRAPTMGTIENLCVFVRFAGETEFGQPIQLYSDMHNSTSQASMRGYFLEESGNQLTVNSTFYPLTPGSMVLSWQDANPRNYYYPQSPANPIGYPPGPAADPDRFGWIRLHTMFSNAVNSIAPMVPPGMIIDADGDMLVDNLSFICRGNADATSALFWPHFWQMNAYPGVPPAFINMFQAVDYNFSLQYPDPMYVGYGGGIDAAEISHEFSHTIGFPDLYHYTWDGVNPCGYWDLMDYCYQVPQHHLTYLKWKYGGWFGGPNPLPPAGTACTLNAVATNPFDHYMFQMPTGEQVWVEYRKAMGLYETRVPNSGLIFYRVDQAYYPWGNAGGPPDEVYVYRPFVSSSPPDGNINWAAFAWEQSMTAFNTLTDPNPFSQNTPGFIANMNIHSIETNTGPQMNFVVGTVLPVIWNGRADSNWFNPANWNTGMVPTPLDFVIIPPVGGWFQCQVQPAGLPAICQNLRNEFMLTVLPGTQLQVTNNFFSIGRFFQDGLTQVTGNFTISYWYAGSWLNSTSNPGAQLMIGGNCLFDSGTQIQMQVGQLIFANLGVSPPVNTFTSNSFGAVLFDLIVNKTGTTLTYVSMLPGMAINLLGSLTVMANTSFLIQAPHFFTCSGNVMVNSTGLLQVQDVQNICTFMFVGPPGLQTISINSPNCYILHLDVQNNAAPVLASSLDVRGNFSITLGTFIANNNTIFLRGNWTNNMGLGAFQKGNSRVVFNAPAADQTITVSGLTGVPVEDFYILELNKAAGSLTMNTAGQQVQCDFYDWTSGILKVTDGQFQALSLLDNCVRGNFVCNAPGLMVLTDTAGNGDLYANLMIMGGSIVVNCPTAGAGSFSSWGVNPGSIQMNGGQLNYSSCGVYILPGSPFSANISSGTIIVMGDFFVQRPEFAPSGGMVLVNTIYPPANVGTINGGAFYDLRLGAPLTITTLNVQVNGSLTIDPGCVFNVSNPLTINGSLQLMGTLNMVAPVTGMVQGTASFPAGSLLDVRDANFTLMGQYPIMLDGTLMINNGWLDATNHPITINPGASVLFASGGGGATGKLSCATITALASGGFAPTIGTLELANTDPSAVFALSLPPGNWVCNLDIDILTSVQVMTDLYVNGNLHIISGQLVMDNTGKTIYMLGNWTNDIPATGFVRGTSIIDFSGSAISSISANGGTEHFYTLNVSAGPGVILMDDLAVHNVVNILTSTLQVNGQILSVSGNTNISPGGTLDLDSGSVLETGNNRQVIIQNSGTLQCVGVAGNLATLRGQAGATWHLTAQGGSVIAAQYADFRHLRSTGLTLQPGAIVDATNDFDNCIFRDGASGTSYLTIQNNQTLNITGISFPTVTPGGYNIYKNINSGVVNVLSSSGAFAGPLYEYDPYTRVNWTGYDPNLIVQSFAVSVPNPYVADQVSYSVTIKNDSPNPVQQTFKIHLFKNRGTPPGWGESGDYNHNCPTLAPYATHSYSFTGVYSMTAESWTSWLLIDPEGAVQETVETDNRDSEAVTWQALPAVSGITVTKTGASAARVAWTYPIWVSRYKVYSSTDPYGTFTYLDSTTNTYYDVPLTSPMYFYLIKAERDTP